ncbi:MAG: GH116 family glycosyl hydrolase [Candidatus Aminicenantaceae bacterium]
MDFISMKRRTTHRLFLQIIASVILLFFFLCSQNSLLASDTAVSVGNGKDDIKKQIKSIHLELLMEKGICDDQGKEIDGRLTKLLDEARKSGLESESKIISYILDKLNYSKTNLGNFPDCAFDRPIGFKLTDFGSSKQPWNIDAKAEGSACPVGGIGAGAYERTISGNFRYWFLKLGWMVDDTVWANQFHVYMKKGNNIFVQTLSTDEPPSPNKLKSWEWNYPEGKGNYYALFPKSGFSYEKNEKMPAELAVTQFSPVLPNNYRETSYPVAIFKWIAENPGKEPVEVSIMLSWQNMIGWEVYAKDIESHPSDFTWDRNSSGNYNQFIHKGNKKGIVFKKKDMNIKTGNAMLGTMCIAAEEVPEKIKIYYFTDFCPLGSGAQVWKTFSNDGTLENSENSRIAGDKEALAGAIAIKFTLDPREHLEFPVVVAWDFPFYEFEKGVKYRKKYTEFFGANGDNAFEIASEALDKYQEWEQAIDDWQKDIVLNSRLPDWFKQALFNELYILIETSVWDAFTNLQTYLESVDYLMYGTFDVDAYSSWHLLKLWPELELGNMRFFAKTIDWEDPTYKAYSYPVVMPNEVPENKMFYYWNTNKVYGMIPHDLGSPRSRPWVIINAFDWQNANAWKDLNPKFPLRAYRDFLYTGSNNYEFLKTAFKTSVIALDTLEKRFADPVSHIPLNEGIPDQTYDTWKMKGESAFVSMLWLAALKSTSQMGHILMEKGISGIDGISIDKIITKYKSWFNSGRNALQRLWNEEGGYFNIDAHTDDIMTDQLFGLWYTKILGLEENEGDLIIPLGQAEKALKTIYKKNVLGFGSGLMGAVNGRNSQGKQLFSQQGDEVWTGTTFAFASNCILHGLVKEGMHAAYGVYYVVYSPYGQGYFFKTPEAYCNPEESIWNKPDTKYGDMLFRAMKYMRPGAIWAVLESLIKKRESDLGKQP